jgi:transcriptional regulator GlxA family with amidase domain
MADGRRVVFVVFDGMKMLDVAGPAEVLADANLFGASYWVSYVSPLGSRSRHRWGLIGGD